MMPSSALLAPHSQESLLKVDHRREKRKNYHRSQSENPPSHFRIQRYKEFFRSIPKEFINIETARKSKRASHDYSLLRKTSHLQFNEIANPPQQILSNREFAMHGKYLLQEAIASGSYGKVCKGEVLSSNKPIAVKIVPKYLLKSPQEKHSIFQEKYIHEKLKHANIIELIDSFDDEEAYYFILERAENGNLSKYTTPGVNRPLSEHEIRVIAVQLMRAIKYLHDRHIVHHDIKPENILFDCHNVVNLCDFGAARAYNKDSVGLPFAGIIGSHGYLAPEILLGKQFYDCSIDIFSAGVVLFEIAFHYPPFYPPSACLEEDVEFPPSNQIDVSTELKDLIVKMLHKNPDFRISAAEVLMHRWFSCT